LFAYGPAGQELSPACATQWTARNGAAGSGTHDPALQLAPGVDVPQARAASDHFPGNGGTTSSTGEQLPVPGFVKRLPVKIPVGIVLELHEPEVAWHVLREVLTVPEQSEHVPLLDMLANPTTMLPLQLPVGPEQEQLHMAGSPESPSKASTAVSGMLAGQSGSAVAALPE